MDARFFCCILQRGWILVPMLVLLLLLTGAQYETVNFIVDNAPTSELAQEFCETAEQCRSDLAILWLGEVLPDWSSKCPISVHVGNHLGAGGATSFVFDHGEVYGWEMNIQGSAKRILDSVLPHEITHTILASHFREPLPRWLDEGAATSVEHSTEKENYRRMLLNFLSEEVRKGLPFKRMVALKEYPADPMPFYAQGFSVVEFLLALGQEIDSFEHHRLIRFAKTGMESNDWQLALQKHYQIESLGVLQLNWVKWVNAGFAIEKNQIEKNQHALISANEFDPKNKNSLINPAIRLVSTSPSSVQEKYGKSVYEKTVIPIPTRVENEPVVSIPNSFETTQTSVVPADNSSLNQWTGVDQTEAIRIDSVMRPIRR